MFQMVDLTSMYDDIQDRIWEIEKSWRNNLLFNGIRYDDSNVEEDPNRTEEKVRTVIRHNIYIRRVSSSQCPRVDLNKKSLPRPQHETLHHIGLKLARIEILHIMFHYIDFSKNYI